MALPINIDELLRGNGHFLATIEIAQKCYGNIQRCYIRRPTGLDFVFLLLARHSQANLPLPLLRASVGRFLCHMVPTMQDDAPHLGASEGIVGWHPSYRLLGGTYQRNLYQRHCADYRSRTYRHLHFTLHYAETSQVHHKVAITQ